MGYNTCYSLRVKHISSKEEWDRLIGEMNERDLLGYAFAPSEYVPDDEVQVFDSAGECHWYDHDEDMIKIARLFPNAVFQLYGVGEGYDDIWYIYYQGDNVEECRAKIVFPPPRSISW